MRKMKTFLKPPVENTTFSKAHIRKAYIFIETDLPS